MIYDHRISVFNDFVCNRSEILFKTIGNLIRTCDSFVILYKTGGMFEIFRFYINNFFYAFPNLTEICFISGKVRFIVFFFTLPCK